MSTSKQENLTRIICGEAPQPVLKTEKAGYECYEINTVFVFNEVKKIDCF